MPDPDTTRIKVESVDDWQRRLDRAEAFVRDCFYLMGQPHDAANAHKVRLTAHKVLRACEQ